MTCVCGHGADEHVVRGHTTRYYAECGVTDCSCVLLEPEPVERKESDLWHGIGDPGGP